MPTMPGTATAARSTTATGSSPASPTRPPRRDPDWEAAKALFAAEEPEAAERRALLSGRAATASAGPVVCACHGVGADVIAATIAGGRRLRGGGGHRLQGRNELRLLHPGDPQDAGRPDRLRRVIF